MAMACGKEAKCEKGYIVAKLQGYRVTKVKVAASRCVGTRNDGGAVRHTWQFLRGRAP